MSRLPAPADSPVLAAHSRAPTPWVAVGIALGLATLASPTAAAEIEREVEISVRGAERTERVRWMVRPGPDDDAIERSSVAILLDHDRELVSAEGWCIAPDGERKKIRSRDRDVVDWPGDSLHDSARFLVLSCPEARAGGHLEASWEVRGTPVFPAGRLVLDPDPGDTVTRLSVTLRGPEMTWYLAGADPGLRASPLPDGVRLEGENLVASEEGGPLARALDLHFVWGHEPTWPGVARWYRDLLEPLPRADPEVRAAARTAASGLPPAEALEAIAALVQRDVRYVAVEVGIGGWRPSSPSEVWARKWGDCKDKALLLIDLLAEVGIEARPALALLGGDRRVATEFPSPFHFNHVVAAVRADHLGPMHPAAPRSGDWLILDATQRRGGGAWLNPSVQGQWLLLVGADGGELLPAPVTPAGERLLLEVKIAEDRSGELIVDLVGSAASRLLEEIEVAPAATALDFSRRLAVDLLGPIELEAPEWRRATGPGPPTLRLVAGVRFPETAPLAPPEVRWLPEPRDLDPDDPLPFEARPGELQVRWEGPLPPGCLTDPENDRHTATAVGEVGQTTESPAPGRMLVSRLSRVQSRWLDDDESYEAYRQLALAEHRLLRRRLRFSCPAGSGR